jgi:hypothetical protein
MLSSITFDLPSSEFLLLLGYLSGAPCGLIDGRAPTSGFDAIGLDWDPLVGAAIFLALPSSVFFGPEIASVCARSWCDLYCVRGKRPLSVAEVWARVCLFLVWCRLWLLPSSSVVFASSFVICARKARLQAAPGACLPDGLDDVVIDRMRHDPETDIMTT